MGNKTETRKEDHIKICLEKNVEKGSTWLENALLVPKATPEIDYHDVELRTKFLGREMKAPVVISAITGGAERAGKINKELAKAAKKLGIGFGVGSQRAMLEKPELKNTYAPDIVPPLKLGNIGVPQIKKGDEIAELGHAINAHAMCVHLNTAQELAQPEGDTEYKHGLEKIHKLSKKIPVIGKETGSGMSRRAAEKLKMLGASAIDVGGHGGTNWVKVEEYRSEIDTPIQEIGIPTAASILDTNAVSMPKIATGGIRNGVQAVKALVLGADLVGIALPALKWQQEGKLEKRLEQFVTEIKKTMTIIGCRNIQDTKNMDISLHNELREWCDNRGIDPKHYANRRSIHNII